GCGALTHLIAWALVPAAVVTLAGALAIEWRGIRASVMPVLALGAGLIAAAVMFYGSFGFRVADHLSSVLAYGQFLSESGTTSHARFATVMRQHVKLAFVDLRPAMRALLAASVAGAFALAAAGAVRAEQRRRWFALLLPPLAVMSGYVLSLGRYPNYHAGYALLIQTSAWWTSAA